VVVAVAPKVPVTVVKVALEALAAEVVEPLEPVVEPQELQILVEAVVLQVVGQTDLELVVMAAPELL
jgi:hypothetical protein